MNIQTYPYGNYQIVKVKDQQSSISHLDELKDLIVGYLKRGKNNIAVSFSDAAYIYSGALGILIDCHNMIMKKNGTLSIIEPDPNLFTVLEDLSVDHVINMYVSEEFLPK